MTFDVKVSSVRRKQPNYPADPESPIVSLGFVFAVFSALCLMALLRNTFALSFPSFYAEDGKWAGLILQNGFLDTAFNARDEFPVLGIVLLQSFGLAVVDIVFGGDISIAPAVFALISGAYLAFVGLLPLLCMRQQIGTWPAVLIGVALVCIPTGASGDEIFGRLHNLGFYSTVSAQIVMFSLLYNQPPRWVRIIQFTYILVLMLTFPVVIGQFAVFAGFFFFTRVRRGEADALRTVLLFAGMFALTFLALSGKNLTSAGGSANLEPRASAMIEFGVARAILYPLVAGFYEMLNDTLTVMLLVAVLAVALWLVYMSRRRISGLFDFRFFLLANFGLVLAATLVMRSALTFFFNDYGGTYPDRYFYAVNAGFVILLISLIAATPAEIAKSAGLASSVAMIASWIAFTPVFELSQPRAAQRSIGTMEDVVCNWVSGRGVLLAPTTPGLVDLPIYPVTPDYIWRIQVPERYFNRTLVDQCQKDDAGA